MSGTSSSEITQLLHAWRGGDQFALQKLTPVVYEELHRMARHYMSRERDGYTLQTTALINEVYLRLVKVKEVEWQDASGAIEQQSGIVGAKIGSRASERADQQRSGESVTDSRTVSGRKIRTKISREGVRIGGLAPHDQLGAG